MLTLKNLMLLLSHLFNILHTAYLYVVLHCIYNIAGECKSAFTEKLECFKLKFNFRKINIPSISLRFLTFNFARLVVVCFALQVLNHFSKHLDPKDMKVKSENANHSTGAQPLSEAAAGGL